MDKRTRVIHQHLASLPKDNEPLIGPIYQSVKFDLSSLAATEDVVGRREDGFTYSRASNPTVRQLELLVAELQEREEAIASASGMAAISTTLMALLRQGDHVVMSFDSYKPTRTLVTKILSRFGVTYSMLSIDDLQGLERVLKRGKTKLVIFESPTNPMNKIANIEKITALARKHCAWTVLDNTFAGLHNHAQYDIDYFVHSLTKYASGHGDVMAGAVVGDQKAIAKLRLYSMTTGPVLDPHAAFLVLRGMRTYFLRYERQCENALKIARFLQDHSHVARVHYPGLPEDPGHGLAARQMSDFGSIVSFDLDGTSEHMRRFIDSLDLFRLTFSLGSTESLVLPPAVFVTADLDAQQLRESRITPTSVRLAVGIEAADDLIADLKQAFRNAYARS